MNQKHAPALLTLLAGALFITLAFIVSHFPQEVAGIDASVVRLVGPMRTETGARLFDAISFFGSIYGITLGAFVLLLFSRRLLLGVPVALALAASSVMATSIKVLIARARPEPLQWLAPLHTYSFPSGHATSVMVLYGGIACYFLLHAKEARIRRIVVSAAVLLILLVGLSRIVLGYHFFSDVIGGYLLGLFWLGLIHMVMPKRLAWPMRRKVIPTGRSH